MSDRLNAGTVERLMIEHDRLDEVIRELRRTQSAIIYEICKANGACPLCRNWYYPYCGA